MNKERLFEELRQKHGHFLREIVFNSPSDEVEVDGERVHKPRNDYDEDYPTLMFIFKKMGFDLFAATTEMAAEKPIQAVKTQMEATLVWGEKEWLNDPVVFQSVMAEFMKINKARSAELKKI